MNYRIEIFDTWGRRIAVVDETPLLEIVTATPDQPDLIQGLLPISLTDLGPGYELRVFIDDALVCRATLRRVAPYWGDTRKLILDRYVSFHEMIEIEAERLTEKGNTRILRAYRNRAITAIVKDAIQAAPGTVHYTVAHGAFPDGAEREYQKFLARKTSENELEIGGIGSGQWVGGGRINLSAAYAKDGDTIAGVVVDGVAWPDIRLTMIDSEESSRNAHAIKRHPEVAFWTNAEYNASTYKLKADAATNALQDLIDAHGVDYIELNPHQDVTGAYDNRVDAYGRHVGLVYGGGLCFNAAQVELGVADVYLYEDGRYNVPEMGLKDFFSYAGSHSDSIETAPVVLSSYDVSAGVFEVLTALAYAAGGYGWSLDSQDVVSFRKMERPDSVLYYDPVEMALTLGSDARDLANLIYFTPHPLSAMTPTTYARQASIDEYDEHEKSFAYFSIFNESDAAQLCEGILDDFAYPAPSGNVLVFHGAPSIRVGDILELRGAPLRRLERRIDGEWDNRFEDEIVGRVQRLTHRFAGKQISTFIELTSPLRSVVNPLSFMIQSQPPAKALFQFRLDDATIGLDLGYHLD